VKWVFAALFLILVAVAPAAWGEETYRATLTNGLRLVVMPDPGTDIVAIDLMLDISAADEPAEKVGIRYLTQRLLLRGTTTESGDSMAQRLSQVGGVVDMSLGLDYVEVYALVPADGFDLALAMLADIVRHPAFLPEQVELQKRGAAEAAAASLEDPFQATYSAVRDVLYPGHPYARSTYGGAAALARISRDDVIAFHRERYLPNRAVVAICGGVTSPGALRAIRAKFGDWLGRPFAPRVKLPVSRLATSETVARELPTSRAQLMIGFPAPAAGEPGYYELQIIDSLLTGRSGARLPKLIREQLGLAYDISTFCPTLSGPSHFAVYVVTEPYAVDAVRSAVMEALAKLRREPPSEEELTRAKRYLLGAYALGHQRMREQAYALAWYEVLGLGEDFPQRYAAAIQAVTPARVQATAASVLGNFVLAVTMPAG
jgi:zinc protease